ncbi:MAG: pyridoxal phosphate-dependent aminotransferase [Terriglobales bacterium]
MFSKRTGWGLSPNHFTEAYRELQSAGIKLLDLTISNPTRAGLRYSAEAILESLRNPAALDYDPQPKGLLSAREAVVGYYREGHNAAVDPESLVLTTSTSEGYSHVLRLLCNPGDEILVPKPSYPLFEYLADLQDVTLVPYPLIYDHGWQIDFHLLTQEVNERTRGIVLVHPNNPTGSFVRIAEQEELNKFCRSHDLALIVDEVFLDYAHDGHRRQTFAANEEALTFTLSGLSKTSGLPQMKLSWILTSGPSQKATTALDRLEIIADTFLSVNAPIQLAAPVLMEQRHAIQPPLLERIRKNLVSLDDQLSVQAACSRLQVEGGWYVALRVPATGSDEDLAIEIMRKARVTVYPGHFYDFPGDGYLVLSLITAEQEFREGIRRIMTFLA